MADKHIQEIWINVVKHSKKSKDLMTQKINITIVLK